jgi:protocatechuate 3,4-dioxygenase beta subunit
MEPASTTTHDHRDDEHDDEHDRGLAHDLATLAARRAHPAAPTATPPGDAVVTDIGRALDRRLSRRRALTVLGGGAAALTLAACQQVTGGGLVAIPTETAGPYPGDGSNGPNVLTTSGIVRSDIRSSFGSMSGTATGVKLTIKMKVLDVSEGGANKTGAAVYLWHADRLGRYSLYSSGVTNQNYLRGVQVVDADGMVTFTSTFPGCYDGRWPHIHFEIYPSAAKATTAANKIATSQMAMPVAPCQAVYATSSYTGSAANLAKTSITTDNVFRDGYSHQLANVTGSVAGGYTARMTMAVA